MKNKGFTLVEVMVSLLMLAIFFGILIQGFYHASDYNIKANQMKEAFEESQAMLETGEGTREDADVDISFDGNTYTVSGQYRSVIKVLDFDDNQVTKIVLFEKNN